MLEPLTPQVAKFIAVQFPSRTTQELYTLWQVCDSGRPLAAFSLAETRNLGHLAHAEAVRRGRR